MTPVEKQNLQKFSDFFTWRRQVLILTPSECSDRNLMLTFRKISGKTYALITGIPAKHHYDSIQAFDSNKY